MKRFKPGQLVVEALIAVAVISIGLLAMVQLANKSISNSGMSKRQSQATAFAQEGMEWVRNQKLTMGWAVFKNYIGIYCINDLSSPAAGLCTNKISGTDYARTVTFNADNSVAGVSQIKVVVDVSWQDASGGGGPVRTAHAKQETVLANY